jgi:xylulokinase
MYLLGFDIGTSSIKATLMDAQTQTVAASATSPKKEMEILAPRPGWAEQEPMSWWQNVKQAAAEILATSRVRPSDIKAIGITYQMHGLVAIDKSGKPLRPSIIWCDSRAVEVGARAAKKIGPRKCLENLLNYPGNFTASKLRWVRENEPKLYKQIHKVMLPGDFIAMKMTGHTVTTVSGLSEGIFWDFKKNQIARQILAAMDIDPALLPETVETFGVQGELTWTPAKSPPRPAPPAWSMASAKSPPTTRPRASTPSSMSTTRPNRRDTACSCASTAPASSTVGSSTTWSRRASTTRR